MILPVYGSGAEDQIEQGTVVDVLNLFLRPIMPCSQGCRGRRLGDMGRESARAYAQRNEGRRASAKHGGKDEGCESRESGRKVTGVCVYTVFKGSDAVWTDDVDDGEDGD